MRRLLPFVLGGALSIAAIAPAAAAPNQFAGAGGLVAAIVQAQVRDINVLNISDSLNNLLQNADVAVLTNFLNDSEVLSRFNITVQDIDVNVLTGVTTITLLGGTVITLV